jgi:hypothetical protein
MSKFLLTTVCAFGLLLSVASAEEVEKELQKLEFTRWVPTGTKRTIWFLYGANPDCSPWDLSEVRTTKSPEHGAVEIVPGETFAQFAKDSVRANCNDKKIRSLNVSYKSFGGYLGPDEFDLLVLWPSGRAWEAHFKIIVR